MFSPLTRYGMIALSIFAAVGMFLQGRWIVGSLFVVAAGLLVWGHQRYGNVWLAFQAYRRGDLDGLARRLADVKHPERLEPQSRAYFELLSGVVAHREGRLEAARAHLGAALAGGLRTTHIQAVARVHLAHVELEGGDPAAARAQLAQARAIPHRPALDAMIGAVEEAVGKVDAG